MSIENVTAELCNEKHRNIEEKLERMEKKQDQILQEIMKDNEFKQKQELRISVIEKICDKNEKNKGKAFSIILNIIQSLFIMGLGAYLGLK
jgi:hypothetical protein